MFYDTKHFQTCASCAITVRSRYVKFLCHENSQSQLIFIGDYSHNNCLLPTIGVSKSQVE